ncbi:MAG TPA: DUF481 domain-containing protein [Gemmatimonadales bacterium]
MRAALILGFAVSLAAPARAQDSLPKRFKVAGDLSFVNTGGNSDVTTLGLGEKIEWMTSPRFTLKQELRWVYGEDSGEENANALLTDLRGEYGLTSRVSLFAGVTYDYNLFAGVKRHFAEYTGLGFLVLDRPKDKVRLDAGLSLNQEWEINRDEADNFPSGRLGGDYRHAFSEKAYLQQILEFIPNFDTSSDYRLNTETALVAPITGGIAIKVGYIVRYRGEPPEGFNTTDTLFRTGIQISN